jgi:hypothetical protein
MDGQRLIGGRDGHPPTTEIETMTEREKVHAALKVVQAVAETIREVGTTPAGPLYAALMAKGCTLDGFEKVIGILTSGERPLVLRRGDMLTWNA